MATENHQKVYMPQKHKFGHSMTACSKFIRIPRFSLWMSMHSVHCHCWLGVMKGIRPVNN